MGAQKNQFMIYHHSSRDVSNSKKKEKLSIKLKGKKLEVHLLPNIWK